MIQTIFLGISTLLPLISPYVYIKSILRGDSKPHRTTRFVYLVIGTLTTASLFSTGNNVALCISSASLIQSIVLFILSIRYGTGGWEKMSIACLLCSVIGIVAWQLTNNPIIGLYGGILADFFGSIPTIIKTISNPNSEEPMYYAIDAIAAFFNILALSALSIESISYPFYLVSINSLIAVLALRIV